MAIKRLLFILLLVPCSVFAYDIWGRVEIRDVKLTPDGNLEVIKVTPSIFVYPEGGKPPGVATKYIYSVKDGKIYLKEKIEGVHYPESIEIVPEKIEFDTSIKKD